jgi:hypothetical protein
MYDKNTGKNITATTAEAKKKKASGRYGDTEMAHVTEGEIVLPLDVQDDMLMNDVRAAFKRNDIPLERYVVKGTDGTAKHESANYEKMEGSDDDEMMQINPETGEEEFFLKKLFKKVVPIAAEVVGSSFGVPGVGSAIGSAIVGGDGSAQAATGGGTAQAASAGGASKTLLPAPVEAANQNQVSTSVGGGGMKISQLTPVDVGVTGGVATGDRMSPIGYQQAGLSQDDMTQELLQKLKILAGNRNPQTGGQEFYGEANLNAQLLKEIQQGDISTDQAKQIMRNAGFTGEFGNGNAERFFSGNQGANQAGFTAAATQLGNKFDSPSMSNPNNPHTKLLSSVNAGALNADAVKDLSARAGFTGVHGNGNAERFFSNVENAANLERVSQNYGALPQQQKVQNSFNPEPVTIPEQAGTPAVTRASSVTPVRSPRFRTSRFNVGGGSMARNF